MEQASDIPKASIGESAELSAPDDLAARTVWRLELGAQIYDRLARCGEISGDEGMEQPARDAAAQRRERATALREAIDASEGDLSPHDVSAIVRADELSDGMPPPTKRQES